MRALPTLAACLLASTALAQTRQPAQITTTPSATPREYDLLDKAGNWTPFGSVSGGVFQGSGRAAHLRRRPDWRARRDSGHQCGARFQRRLLVPACWTLQGHRRPGRQARRLPARRRPKLDDFGRRRRFVQHGGAGRRSFPPTGNDSFTLRDIEIGFTQPDTSVRASLAPFPPGIYGQTVGGIGPGSTGAGRPKIQNVRISGANTCIDLRGNAGGAFLDTIECGAFSYGLRLDGGRDGSHLSNWHEWNWGAQSVGLAAIYGDGTNVCLEVGRSDGLLVDGVQCWQSSVVYTANAGGSLDQNLWTNVGIDQGAWRQANGDVYVANLFLTSPSAVPSAAASLLSVTGGHLRVSNISLGATPTVTPVQVAGGTLHLNGGVLAVSAGGAVSAAQVTSGSLELQGVKLVPVGSTAWTAGFIAASGAASGLLIDGGTFVPPSVAPNGNILVVGTDVQGNTVDLATNGWPVSLPTITSGYYRGCALGVCTTYQSSMTLSSNNGASIFNVNALAGANAWMSFQANGTALWRSGNRADASNKFSIRDVAAGSVDAALFSTGGDIMLGETTANVLTLTGGLKVNALPTSCSGKPTGTIWNNASALGVCP